METLIIIGFVFNFFSFVIEAIRLKNFWYDIVCLTWGEAKEYKVTERVIYEDWQTLKIPVFGWLIFILVNVFLPFLGGIFTICWFEFLINDCKTHHKWVSKRTYFSKPLRLCNTLLCKIMNFLEKEI